MSVFIGSKLEAQPLQRSFFHYRKSGLFGLTGRSSFLSGQWVKHFHQSTIFRSPKVTHIFKNPSSDYEQIVNKEWKDIIENLGLTKQDTCKNAQGIYGTPRLKSEAERTEAISTYLHHKLKPNQLFQKAFFNPQTK